MALRLPWSDRVAALGRHGQAMPEVGLGSRKEAEIDPKPREGEELRPASLRTGYRMDLGGASLDVAGRSLLDRGGQPVALRAQSMKVLLQLARRPGEVVSRDELLDGVWGEVHVTDDSLTQCVSEIRQALGDQGHRVLQTVPKRGYRLVPVAVTATEAVPVAEAPTPETVAPVRRRLWLVAALGLLVILGLGALTMRPQDPARLPVIAVLPFEDLTGEPRWERLGRGLAAEIGTDLARGKGIVVIPAETAEATVGDPLTAAQVLSARFVLDGTLQADGEELRVTARLTDANDGAVVWSDRWTRPAEDVFAVQDEIVGRIGGTLDGIWTGMLARVVRAGAEERPARSLEAYELYLLGAEAKHQFTPESFARAVTYLRRALEIDPDFVQAMVTLSIVLMWQADYASNGTEAAALIAESFQVAERAVRIDPDDPNALLRLAATRVLQGRRAEAWPLSARAVEIAPLNPDVLTIAAWIYVFSDQGRVPLEWAERAIALNPGHPDWYNCGLAMTALFAGDLNLARQAASQAPPLAEMLVTRGAAEALAENIEEARTWFERFATETRYRSLSALYYQDDLSRDSAWAPLVEGARLAGFPVTEAEAHQSASR